MRSIVTKTGDQGATALLYNRRVSKCHPRVVASGEIDELNAALGAARTNASDEVLRGRIFAIQQELISLMGEIATLPEDTDRYVKDGFARVSGAMTCRLEEHVKEVESMIGPLKGWATPGANPLAAALDIARTVCRRAERAVCALKEAGEPLNEEIIIYLNRLSDLLWLWARRAETSHS
jgi:cob(I)alamin adenosyltransferase